MRLEQVDRCVRVVLTPQDLQALSTQSFVEQLVDGRMLMVTLVEEDADEDVLVACSLPGEGECVNGVCQVGGRLVEGVAGEMDDTVLTSLPTSVF